MIQIPFLSSLRTRISVPVVRALRSSYLPQIPVGRYHTDQYKFKTLQSKLALTKTGEFQTQLKAEVSKAQKFIDEQVKKGKKGFVVLDIDETVLDHRGFYEGPYKQMKQSDFYTKWDEWIQQKKAPALPATKPLIDWLNQLKIPYVFVTGRIEAQREVTLQNLKQAKVIGDSFKGLYCKPNAWWEQTTAEHKKRVVCQIEQETQQEAIASIGDREADMMLDDPRNFRLSSSVYYPSRNTESGS